MANIDKLVTYAELKLGQFGVDYRENYETDVVHEVEPRDYTVNGTSIKVDYDSHSYDLDLTQSGIKDISEEDTQKVVNRLREFFGS